MSDEARQPMPDQQPTGHQPPRLSLAKEDPPAPNRTPTFGGRPATDRAAGGRGPASEGRQAPMEDPAGAEPGPAVPVADRARTEAGQGAPAEGRVPTFGGRSATVAGQGSVQDAVPGFGSGHGQGQAAGYDTVPASGSFDGPAPVRDAVPAPGSVHDQQTLTSLPAAGSADAGRAAWANPAGGFAPSAPGPTAPQPNPFARPASAQQPNPFAPPAPAPQGNPFAAHGGAEPVPPPPIAPDGPGQVPYGYPGTTPAYGYPGPQQAAYAPYPNGTGYAWPGMQAPPSNGMGTASLVLGIISAVGFILWPLALVLGILALIFGGIGRGKASRGEATNPGVALAGIICGAAGIVLVLGLFALFIAVDG
ncbi:DUF4190 domain-containing protein [Streptomyces cyanogenus]|uniref:DUF4190 domain-containing protein n=1 Tax=Streptomyces cyanogenus TaxID=80860 RepID=A0ABX7TWT1_STRCY|nr:DUF4190 domain-containing protein [Streptomyces cyanogenus]QTE01230.1 hypothetical protein S1361_28130 [Streptomyces cyanogenus]